MKDCNNEIEGYYDEDVRLQGDQNKLLTDRRRANRKRLRKGLKANGKPSPIRFVIQGSRAMGTTIQEPDNTYDIDDGVVFNAADLVGEKGASLSPLDVRKMVRDAVDDGSFKTPPFVKTNCVRIKYDDGPHVDQPVYRRLEDGTLELASSAWKKSDPAGVNKWFRGQLDQKSGGSAKSQMKALIRLFKAYCKNRPSYSLPSGFALTRLVDEAFRSSSTRLDVAFREAMKAIRDRLAYNLVVTHPVVAEDIIGSDKQHLTKNLKELLDGSIKEMETLDSPSCTKSKALKVWKKVFQTDYFDDAISSADEAEKKSSISAVASLGVIAPKPWSM